MLAQSMQAVKLMVVMVSWIVSMLGMSEPAYAMSGSMRVIETERWGAYIFKRVGKDLKRARQIAQAAVKSSERYSIPVSTIIAVMEVESGFNVRAKSSGGAIGLMQVIPYWHKKKIGTRSLWDIETAVDVGTQILRENLDRGGSHQKALRMYCGCRGDGYIRKVQRQHAIALAGYREAGVMGLEMASLAASQDSGKQILSDLQQEYTRGRSRVVIETMLVAEHLSY